MIPVIRQRLTCRFLVFENFLIWSFVNIFSVALKIEAITLGVEMCLSRISPGTPLQATAIMPHLHWRILARTATTGLPRFQALMV